jgi:hypothetical protein
MKRETNPTREPAQSKRPVSVAIIPLTTSFKSSRFKIFSFVVRTYHLDPALVCDGVGVVDDS